MTQNSRPTAATLASALGRRRSLLWGAALACSVLASGCAVEWQNRQASKELAEMSKPPGSVYLGWRVFEDRCARCHGVDATGMGAAPNLLQRVGQMGQRQFVSTVLNRYDFGLPPAQARSSGAAKEALVDDVLRGEQAPLTMPAWGGEPRVTAHIVDLYAYLSARAEGKQGPGRPTP